MTKKLETSFILLLCILFPFFFFVFARSDTYVKSEIEISFELLKRSHFTGIQNNLLVFSIYAIPLFAIQTQFELRFVEDEAKQVAAPHQTRYPQGNSATSPRPRWWPLQKHTAGVGNATPDYGGGGTLHPLTAMPV